MPRSRLGAIVAIAAIPCALAGCHKHRSGPSLDVGGFAIADAEPVRLDQILAFPLAAPIDPATVSERSARITAVAGGGLGVAARGTWRVRAGTIEFVPELPLGEPVATSGGLQPDTTYEVEFLGGDHPLALRTVDGRWLDRSPHTTFRTRSGSTPGELFGSEPLAPPRLAELEFTPRDENGRWQLGGGQPATLLLGFDRPLDPSIANLPRHPTAATPGPIALDYDDFAWGSPTRIAIDVELLQNTVDGATVRVRPRSVLPSAARLRLGVSGELRALAGARRGAGDPQPERVIATATALATQFGALAFDFEDEDATATGASRDFPEPEAVVVDGALTVPDAFPPLADVGDWTPNGADTTLRTDVQTLYYQNGRQRTFEGGVLHVKELHIGPNQIVRGLGPNPLVLVVDGDARIDGALTVRGANADRLFVGGTYRGPGDVSPPPAIGSGHGPIGPNPDPFVPVGAAAGAGGGRGGATSTLAPRTFGSPGESAPGTDGGGRGGTLVAQALGQASGGGGGAGAVTGDPWFPSPAGPGDLFPQRAGRGGAGIGRTLPGGAAGTPWFTNATAADDFWGRAWVPRERRAIVGELAAPVGGSGGGAGGALDLPGWFYYLGGDGGGGGGALVLRVRGTLTLGPQGRIDADGGHGSGTEYLYSTERMGGGGGGAGGMVVLMAGDGIVIHTHGGTFANRDYDFPISADGGICRSSSFGPWYFRSKYPQNGQPTFSGSQYDDAPLGGFGGMGLVQLMVPVGRSNDDDTNTVLDDAITIVRNGVPLRGLAKQRFLGWRGFPDENGVLVDDFGNPTGTIGGQGDIRPDPVLLPVPFATHGTARAQSGWLPLGGLFRRALAAPDGLPRGVVGENLRFERHARPDGWLPYGGTRLLPEASGAALLPAPAVIASIARDGEAYRVELTAPLPNTAPDAWAGRLALLGNGGNGDVHARSRVLASGPSTLLLAADLPLPEDLAAVQLYAWPAELATVAPGSYLGFDNTPLPRANVRIGFAFHRDASAATGGFDPGRWPADGSFLYDLGDPATVAALRALEPRYLAWDVTLDGEFRTSAADRPPAADADSRIALRRFWLPMRF